MTVPVIKMYIKCMFCYLMLSNVYSNIENNFIIDYFHDKKTPTVVGITCYSITERLPLIKDFSKIGISVAFSDVNNETSIHVLAQTNYWKLGIFVDIRCLHGSHIASILFSASEYRLFGELHFWLFLVSNLTDILNIIDDRAFGFSTDVLIAVFNNNTNSYDLYDIYNLSKEHGGKLNVMPFGNWNKNAGLSIVKISKLDRRSNLQGFQFKAMFFKCLYKADNVSLIDYLDDYAHNTIDQQNKYGFHVLTHLSEIYNFSLEILESTPWLRGDKRGPLEVALANNTIDFTGSPITLTRPRTFVFKYVHQDWPFRTCFIFRNPQPKNMKIGEILRPFTIEVWHHVVLFFVLILTALILVLHYECIQASATKFSNSFLITVGSLCQQGTEIEMTKFSTRIAFLSVLMFSFLVYNFYSASIVSARLDEPIYKINDSLNELGKLKLDMATEPIIYFEFFLKKKDWDSIMFYENYWSHIPLSKWYMAPEIGMELVQKGGFAYHTHPDVGYKIIDKKYDNREICELMEVNLARPALNAFGVPINSSIVEIVRVGLTKISEVGIRHRQILRWTFRRPRCRRDVLSASSINIYEFAPHLILLIIGMLLSINLFTIEIIVCHFGFYWKLKLLSWLNRLLLRLKMLNQLPS